MKEIVKIFIVVFFIIIVTALVSFVKKQYCGVIGGANSNNIILTSSTLKELSCLISNMLLEGYKDPIDKDTMIVYALKTGDLPLVEKIKENQICDEWGSPIIVVIEKSSLNTKYTFISCGPNQKYDHGQDDDIVEIRQ